MAFLKKAFLSTTLLCLFFLAVPDRIKAQIASIISEDGDGIVGVTSLMNATINGDTNAVKFFAKAGVAVVNQKNIGGASALHIAARMGNVEIATILIESGANVNITDNEGWTPLMRAIMAKNAQLVKLLMNHGADPRQMNSVGETAIVNSASSGCSECLEQLLSNYNFIDNLNIDILRNQLKDAMVIANNKNDIETQSIIKEYSNSELNKNQIYSLSKSHSPSEAPITPKTNSGDGIVMVKSLNSMSESGSKYKFSSKKSEPMPDIYSAKIPQKTFRMIESPDSKLGRAMVSGNQKFVFKGEKKSYSPLVNYNTKHNNGTTEAVSIKPYKEVYVIKTPTDDGANISNSTSKKFIFKGDKKPYAPINILNPIKDKKIVKEIKEIKEINESAVSDKIHSNPSSDKEFIFKGDKQPNSTNSEPQKQPTSTPSNATHLDDPAIEDTSYDTNENKKFIFKGKSKSNPNIDIKSANIPKTEEAVSDTSNSQPSLGTDKLGTDKKFIFKGKSDLNK